jgi:hypothetical protein
MNLDVMFCLSKKFWVSKPSMEQKARITSKGQLMVPKAMREALVVKTRGSRTRVVNDERRAQSAELTNVVTACGRRRASCAFLWQVESALKRIPAR